MSIKTKAVLQAIGILNACNARYKIICEDNAEYGVLETKPVKPVKDRTYKPKINNFKQTGYVEKVLTMKVGDVLEMTVPENLPLEGLRSVIGSTGSAKFGHGAMITTVNKEKGVVEAMRVL